METVICPYCDTEVKVSLVEAEEGCCPDCGAMITPSSIFGSQLDGDEYEDDYSDGYDDELEDEDEDDEDDS